MPAAIWPLGLPNKTFAVMQAKGLENADVMSDVEVRPHEKDRGWRRTERSLHLISLKELAGCQKLNTLCMSTIEAIVRWCFHFLRAVLQEK